MNIDSNHYEFMEVSIDEIFDLNMNEKKYEGRPVWNAYMNLAKNIDQSFYGTDNDGEQKGFFKKLFGK
jgi:hypothetical protein